MIRGSRVGIRTVSRVGMQEFKEAKDLTGSLSHPRSFPSAGEPKRASKLSSIPGSPKANRCRMSVSPNINRCLC